MARKKMTRADRYNKLISLGLSSTKAKYYASEKRYKAGRAYARRRTHGGYSPSPDRTKSDKIIVMYRDKTQETEDYSFIQDYIKYNKKESQKKMVEHIKDTLEFENSIGELGEYRITTSYFNDVNNKVDFYKMQGFVPVHISSGTSFPELNSLINLMLSLLYEPIEKYMFIQELCDNLDMLNNDKAKKNSQKLRELYL